MRPLDIIVMLKLLTIEQPDWQYRDLSASLAMPISEVSEALNRSHMAGLVGENRRSIHRQSLMEFIQYGLHYVFPQVPGTMVTGIATAHSHPFYSAHFSSELKYVWPDENGDIRGLAINPLHKGVVKASKADEKLYLLLASIDIIRVGKTREIKLALEQLKKYILP